MTSAWCCDVIIVCSPVFLVESPPTSASLTNRHQAMPMASIMTRPVRVCLLLARCLKLTALFQSSPPPHQTETAVPPSGFQQGENQWTFLLFNKVFTRGKAAAGPGDGPRVADPNRDVSGTSPTSPTGRVPWKDQVVGKSNRLAPSGR
jgi:hypothetical protein